MDTELARTFLTVVSAGNFVKAGERLFITQSAVSSRIQTLEQQLGCRLFIRNKAGAQLTPQGKQFQKHAATLLRTIEQAQAAVGVPTGFHYSIAIGGRYALWRDILLPWLAVMQEKEPDVAVRAELGFEEELIFGLIDGRIDIALIYTPQSHPGLVVEPLLTDELVLVAGRPCESVTDAMRDFVLVDWGPAFKARLAAEFPDAPPSRLTTNVGWIALELILTSAGSAFIPRRMAIGYLDAGELHLVPNAPVYELPAYVTYPVTEEPDRLERPLDYLRRLVADVMQDRSVQRNPS